MSTPAEGEFHPGGPQEEGAHRNDGGKVLARWQRAAAYSVQ